MATKNEIMKEIDSLMPWYAKPRNMKARRKSELKEMLDFWKTKR